MEKALRFIFIGILIISLVGMAAYFGFIYVMGHNFVHDKPADPSYYRHVANRIYFTTKYRGDKFDHLLDSFLKVNPKYIFDDTANLLGYNDTCSCYCLTLSRIIYFDSAPREAYQITYDADTMYAGGAGVIDIIFTPRNDKWLCMLSSSFDSAEKNRIETRLDTAIIKKLR